MFNYYIRVSEHEKALCRFLNLIADKIEQLDISGNPAAISFLENHPEVIDWSLLSRNAAAIHLLEKNFDKIDWTELSLNPAAIHLLEKNLDKVDWRALSLNPAAIPLLEKNLAQIDWRALSQNTGAFLLLEKHLNKVDWQYMSANPAVLPLLEKHPDKIEWSFLSANPAAIHLLEKNLDRVSWPALSTNPGVIRLLEKNLDKVDWFLMVGNPAAIGLLEEEYGRSQFEWAEDGLPDLLDNFWTGKSHTERLLESRHFLYLAMSGKRKKKTDPLDKEKTKRQRADNCKRKARNAETDFSVVKCSLNSFCHKSASVLPWESVLKDTNKAVAEALSAVSTGLKARKKIDDEDLRQSVELYKSWRDPNVPFTSSAHISLGWFQNASLQMATNATNHIVVNFYRRFQKYIKQRFGITGKERYELLRDVLAPTYEGGDERVVGFRGWIPRNNKGYIDTDNPHLILPVTFRFLQFIENENDRHRQNPEFQQLRSFSLLPFKRGFECSHFKMCKLGLYALLGQAGIKIPDIKSKEGQPSWNDVVDEWWRKLFKIKKFETENRKFAGEILTDGKALSKKDPKQYDFGEVWGLDPGRRDLFVATNNFGQTLSCSTREFYEDAKYKSSNKTIRYWIDHNPKMLEATRNTPSPKTCSLLKLEKYVRFLIPRLDYLLDFRMAKPFRKLKFRRYIFMKKKLRELCEKLTARAGSNTLVGFGDWSATDYGGLIKKCPAGPVKMLENELQRYCTVASVPEFRTSKLHADCHRELAYQFALRKCKDGVVRRVKIHSVLHCRHNGCYGMTVNRDRNASKNILLLTLPHFLGQDRHPAFCRQES